MKKFNISKICPGFIDSLVKEIRNMGAIILLRAIAEAFRREGWDTVNADVDKIADSIMFSEYDCKHYPFYVSWLKKMRGR